MTRASGMGSPVRRPPLPTPDTGEVLDHFVSGFEWSIPTRIEILDFSGLEKNPGEFAGGEILWYSSSKPLRRVHAGPGLLEDFLKLATASDRAILTYARRWGPLWLCAAHNLPWRHDPSCEPSVSDWTPDEDDGSEGEFDDATRDLSDSLAEAEAWFEEPLASWRELSAQARATVRLARRLHDGQFGLSSDWDALPYLPQILRRLLHPSPTDPFVTVADFPDAAALDRIGARLQAESQRNTSTEHAEPESPEERYRRSLVALGRSRLETSMPFQRQVFGEVLNYWLSLSRVQPHLDWTSDRPSVQLGGDGLMGALAVQLLFDCSRTDGLAVCTSCGTPFLPGPRRPRRDRNAYCSDCGLKAAARDAAARYRQTKKYRATYDNWVQKRRESTT